MGREVNKGLAGGSNITGSLNIVDNTIRVGKPNADIVLDPLGTGALSTDNNIIITNTTDSSDSATGSLIIDGGLAISENFNIAGSIGAVDGLQDSAITATDAAFTDVLVTGTTEISEFLETSTTKSGATGTVVHDLTTEGSYFVHNSISGNFTANFTNVPDVDNRIIEVTLVLNQGSTPYLCNAVEIDGAAQTIRWAGYAAPSVNANKIEILTIKLVRRNNAWIVLASLASNGLIPDGSSAARAAPSAQFIKSQTGTNTNGTYWIDLPDVGPTQIYCIMDSAYDGGGWMMTMKATRGTTFNYSSSYWTTNNTLNPSATNQSDGDAKFESFNRFEAVDMLARFPDVGAGGTLGTGLGNWIWTENRFNGGTPISLSNFFNTTPETYLRENGDIFNWNGWINGPFSSQGGWRKYGFNLNDGARQSRWGFLWNNETTPGSNDVDSGIGMGSRQNYSCGDYITCCQTYNGVNRSMRVELYVR